MAAYSVHFEQNCLTVSGIGLFSGQLGCIRLRRGIPGQIRIEQNHGGSWLLNPKQNLVWQVVAENRHTSLIQDEFQIHCIEHLMAPLSLFQWYGWEIEVFGNEIPILDGSSMVWFESICNGFRIAPSHNFSTFFPAFHLRWDWGEIEYCPSSKFQIDMIWLDPYGIEQNYCFMGDSFDEWFLNSRTFICNEDWLRLGGEKSFPGADEHCGILFQLGENGVELLHGEGLRHPLEFLGHKMLDFMGDMALLGSLPCGKWRVKNPGHYHNLEFMKGLLHVLNGNTAQIESARHPL